MHSIPRVDPTVDPRSVDAASRLSIPVLDSGFNALIQESMSVLTRFWGHLMTGVYAVNPDGNADRRNPGGDAIHSWTRLLKSVGYSTGPLGLAYRQAGLLAWDTRLEQEKDMFVTYEHLDKVPLS